MPIRFRCQDCRSRVKVPEGSQGKQVKCPRCGRIQAVPRHQQNQMDDSAASDLTVHTCASSIHRAPKRKEALVGAGEDRFELDDSASGIDMVGGGSTGGGGLDIPDRSSNGYENTQHQQRPSRKERRRIAAREREAKREHEESIARQESAEEQDLIVESRKQVEDLFATSSKKDFSQDDTVTTSDAATEADTVSVPVSPSSTPPQPIALRGGGQPIDQVPVPTEQAIERQVTQQQLGDYTSQQQTEQEPETTESWSIDLTTEAYPFLRIIPWVLRITALMLIGPAFKVMLVADAQGFSGVVSMLILFAGLAIVVVTWTVGEIATAVRDIALRKATG